MSDFFNTIAFPPLAKSATSISAPKGRRPNVEPSATTNAFPATDFKAYEEDFLGSSPSGPGETATASIPEERSRPPTSAGVNVRGSDHKAVAPTRGSKGRGHGPHTPAARVSTEKSGKSGHRKRSECTAPFGECAHFLRDTNGNGTGGCHGVHPRLGEEICLLITSEITKLGQSGSHTNRRLHICTAAASVCCRLSDHAGTRCDISLEQFVALPPGEQLELIRKGTGRFHFLTEDQMYKGHLDWNRAGGKTGAECQELTATAERKAEEALQQAAAAKDEADKANAWAQKALSDAKIATEKALAANLRASTAETKHTAANELSTVLSHELQRQARGPLRHTPQCGHCNHCYFNTCDGRCGCTVCRAGHLYKMSQ